MSFLNGSQFDKLVVESLTELNKLAFMKAEFEDLFEGLQKLICNLSLSSFNNNSSAYLKQTLEELNAFEIYIESKELFDSDSYVSRNSSTYKNFRELAFNIYDHID